MKLYPDCKKLVSIIILIILFSFSGAFSYAQTTISDVQNKINEKNAEIARLQQEIASYQTQMDDLEQQKDSLNNSIKSLDVMRKKLNADIAVTQKKIDRTNLTIQNLSSDIVGKQNAINNEMQSIISGIKNTDELERTSILENLLSQNDFTTVWTDLDNITAVREKLRKDIVDLRQTKGALENTRKETITAKNQLTKLKAQLTDQKKIVVQNTNEKNQLLKQTKNNEANYQKLLKDRITQLNAFQKEVFDYEAQLRYVFDPSKLPGRILSWPLENVFVTQLFGKTKDSKRLYVSGSHSGVDFKAAIGTPVMAMADGVVLGVGNTDLQCPKISFGKYIFIQYNNGLFSTFGHMSLIKVNNGERVQRGEVVGYSGATGHVTGPHLHVSLYAPQSAQITSKVALSCGGRSFTLPLAPTNAYLNVLDFLPPFTINSKILKNRPNE